MCNCLNPIKIRIATDELGNDTFIFVGCGNCPLCLKRRANDWTFRLEETFKASSDAFFVTLTYNDAHLPRNNGKKKVQDFLKRFRKNNFLINTDFKYYLVSELGGEHGRLHYHALFFNTGMNWRQLYLALERDWQNGFIKLSYCNRNRINYCSKYCLQNMFKERNEYRFVTLPSGQKVREKVKKENYFFMCCSKGIGIEFVTEAMRKFVRSRMDFTIPRCVNCGNNAYKTIPYPIPKYYLLKIYSEDEDVYVELKNQRIEFAKRATLDEERFQFFMENGSPEQIWERSGTSDYLRDERLVDEYQQAIEERDRRVQKAQQILDRAKKCKFSCPPYVNQSRCLRPDLGWNFYGIGIKL